MTSRDLRYAAQNVVEIESDDPLYGEFLKLMVAGDVGGFIKLAKREPKILQWQDMFFEAAGNGPTSFLKAFIKLGANVNQIDRNGWSALEFAVFSCHLEHMKILLDAGADPNENSLIVITIDRTRDNKQYLEMVKLLMKYGADINQPLPMLPDVNLLTKAINLGETKLVEFLRANGGMTPKEWRRQKREGKLNSPQSSAPKLKKPKKPKKTKFDEYSERVLKHFTKVFGKPQDHVVQEIVRGGVCPVELRYIPYSAKRKFAVLFTVGFGFRKMKLPRGEDSFANVELVMALPKDWPDLKQASESEKHAWLLAAIFQLANEIHNSQNYLWLWTVIANGKSLKPFSKHTKFAAWLSSFIAEKNYFIKGDPPVGLYWLVPLYKEEYQLERKHNDDTLLNKFGPKGIPIIFDPKRKNVALK